MLWCLISRLLRDERGTSLIEMTFIIPMLAMLGCGATDLAMCYAKGLKIQQAAARTAEFAIAYGSKGNLATTLQTEAAAAAGVPSSNVVVDNWLECDGTRQTDFNGSCSGSSPARFTSITISDTYTWTMAKLVKSWGTSVPLKGYAAVRIQ